MIWKRCRKCGIRFKGLVCPNCSSRVVVYENDVSKDLKIKKGFGGDNEN